jgi:hypothetical protein
MRTLRRPMLALFTAAATIAGCAPVDASDPNGQAEEEAVAGLKPKCRGVMSRSGLPPVALPFVDHAVVMVSWADLETADQRFDGAGWRTIDDARARGLKIRLRIMAGIHAPSFVKRLGHAPVSGRGTSNVDGLAYDIDCSASGGIAVYNPHDHTGACAAFFWTTPVQDQYEQLMREVARRYESAPEVREVVDSACMTIYAEPFYRAHGDRGSNLRLWNAGLSLATDRACHERAIRVHAAAFPTTRTSLAINAWDVITDQDSEYVRPSFAPTTEFVGWAREQLGRRLVLQNNGLGESDRSPSGATAATNVYCYLGAAAPPKGFQSETLERLGGEAGFYSAVANAVGMGANFVEAPSGYTQFDVERLRQADEALEATP